MGGRGSSSKQTVRYGANEAQEKTVNKIAKQTANLKNEQRRIIDENGNVVAEAKGSAHDVALTVGVMREFGKGAVDIHNHPEGGTFSAPDMKSFGYGVKEIVVSTPEGVYRLIRATEKMPEWVKMRDALEAIPETSLVGLIKKSQENMSNSPSARAIQKISEKWAQIKDTKGIAEANEYLANNKERYDSFVAKHREEVKQEQRRLEVEPYDKTLKQHAKEYGFIYRFEPWKKKSQ